MEEIQKKIIRPSDGLKVLLSLATAIIIIAGLKAAQALILPILLAIFVAIVSYPVTKGLMKLKMPRPLAVFITVMMDCGFLVGLAFLINYLASGLKRTIQIKYKPIFSDKVGELNLWLREHNMQSWEQKGLDGIEEFFNLDRIMSVSSSVFGAAATLLSFTVLILILMTFFLSESHVYKKNLDKIFAQEGPNFQKVIKASTDIQRYLWIKTIISMTTGLLAWGACALAGVDFPLLWGIIAFALNFIPTIGSIVAAIPPIILALLLAPTLGPAIFLMIAYLAINMTLGNFLEPLLLGKQFGIATAVVLLSVLFWGWIWGPIGMLLAVPLTMIIKLAMESSRDLRWVSTLISKSPPPPSQPFHINHS